MNAAIPSPPGSSNAGVGENTRNGIFRAIRALFCPARGQSRPALRSLFTCIEVSVHQHWGRFSPASRSLSPASRSPFTGIEAAVHLHHGRCSPALRSLFTCIEITAHLHRGGSRRFWPCPRPARPLRRRGHAAPWWWPRGSPATLQTTTLAVPRWPRFDTGKTYDSGQKYDQSDPPPKPPRMASIRRNWSRLNRQARVDAAKLVHTKLTGNADVPSPMPTLPALQTLITSAQAAIDEVATLEQTLKVKRADRDAKVDAWSPRSARRRARWRR